MNQDVRHTLTLLAVAAVVSLIGLAGLAHGSADCETKTHCILVSFPAHYTDKEETMAERSRRCDKSLVSCSVVLRNGRYEAETLCLRCGSRTGSASDLGKGHDGQTLKTLIEDLES